MGKLSQTHIATLGSDTLNVGTPPAIAYAAEVYESDTSLTSDKSVMRIKAVASASNTRTTEFWGLTALRIEVQDVAGVVDGTDPYLYGLRVRVSPRVGRNNTAIDDVVGVIVSNRSFTDYGTVYNGTEAVYIGHSGGATKDWNAGVGIDTIADNAIYMVRGPYAYGILMTAPMTTAAIRIPNDALIVGRNAADDGNISILKVDTSNRITIGADKLVVDTSGNVLANTTSANLIGGGKGIQIRSTDGTTVEINASADTAASASSAIYAKGRSGSNDIVGRIQANSGGVINMGGESGGHSLVIRQAGANRLTLTSTTLTVNTDGYDIAVGTTTGTKIGTSTSQKLAFWNKTPIVQPTTAVSAAAFVANTSGIANDTATFGGYTIGKVVAALINVGILA